MSAALSFTGAVGGNAFLLILLLIFIGAVYHGGRE